MCEYAKKKSEIPLLMVLYLKAKRSLDDISQGELLFSSLPEKTEESAVPFPAGKEEALVGG